MSDIKWKSLVEECEWLEKKYKWTVKDVMPTDVVNHKNHDNISDISFRDMYPEFTMKQFYDSIGWSRMIKDTLHFGYKCAKWDYPSSNFTGNLFRKSFIDLLTISVERELEWEYDQYLKDVKELDIKKLCIKYIDIEPEEFETIIAEAEKEFEIEYKAHCEAEEYIENNWDKYKLPWEENE